MDIQYLENSNLNNSLLTYANLYSHSASHRLHPDIESHFSRVQALQSAHYPASHTYPPFQQVQHNRPHTYNDLPFFLRSEPDPIQSKVLALFEVSVATSVVSLCTRKVPLQPPPER